MKDRGYLSSDVEPSVQSEPGARFNYSGARGSEDYRMVTRRELRSALGTVGSLRGRRRTEEEGEEHPNQSV